jgi:hypothetical protein
MESVFIPTCSLPFPFSGPLPAALTVYIMGHGPRKGNTLMEELYANTSEGQPGNFRNSRFSNDYRRQSLANPSPQFLAFFP